MQVLMHIIENELYGSFQGVLHGRSDPHTSPGITQKPVILTLLDVIIL